MAIPLPKFQGKTHGQSAKEQKAKSVFAQVWGQGISKKTMDEFYPPDKDGNYKLKDPNRVATFDNPITLPNGEISFGIDPNWTPPSENTSSDPNEVSFGIDPNWQGPETTPLGSPETYAENTPVPQSSSFGDMAKNFLRQAGRQAISGAGGIISGTTQFAGNTIDFLGKGVQAINKARWGAMDPGRDHPDKIGELISETGKWISRKGEDVGTEANYAADMLLGTEEQKWGMNRKDAAAGDVTKFITKEIVAPAITGSAVFRAIGLLPKVAAGANAVKNASPVAKPILQKAGEFLARSLGMTGIQKAGSKGELATGVDAGIGLGVDIVLGSLGGVLKNVGKSMYGSALRPEIDNASKRGLGFLAKMDKKILNTMERNYMGTARMVSNQIQKTISSAGKQLNSILDSFSDTLIPGKKVVEAAKNEAVKIAKEGAGVGGSEKAEAFLKGVNDWVSKNKNLSPKQLLDAKRNIVEQLENLFKRAAETDPTTPLKQDIAYFIWKNIDSTLDNLHPSIPKLNKEMSVAYSILPGINRILDPTTAKGFSLVLKKILPSTLIGSAGGKLAYKAGTAFNSLFGRTAGREGILGPIGAMAGRKKMEREPTVAEEPSIPYPSIPEEYSPFPQDSYQEEGYAEDGYTDPKYQNLPTLPYDPNYQPPSDSPRLGEPENNWEPQEYDYSIYQ